MRLKPARIPYAIIVALAFVVTPGATLAAGTSIEASVGPWGGHARLGGLISVVVEKGTFDKASRVSIRQARSQWAEAVEIAPSLNVAKRARFQIYIRSTVKPSRPLQVVAEIPAGLMSGLTQRHRATPFILDRPFGVSGYQFLEIAGWRRGPDGLEARVSPEHFFLEGGPAPAYAAVLVLGASAPALSVKGK